MKKIILTCLAVFLLFGCFGQRYDLWVSTTIDSKEIKGRYKFSNDSVLALFPKSTLSAYYDNHFVWNDVTSLKLLNITRNRNGMLAGALIGTIGSVVAYKIHYMNSTPGQFDFSVGIIIFSNASPFIGALIGYLATSKKTNLPMHEMNSKDKNQLLKSNMKRKSQ